jgi:hypothetical protein
VAVEVLASPVVPHGGARVGVAGGDLDVTEVNSCVTCMVVANVWRSMCGCAPGTWTPAVVARCRR